MSKDPEPKNASNQPEQKSSEIADGGSGKQSFSNNFLY